jgi:tetratricopeptide (TPR) repeat protein
MKEWVDQLRSGVALSNVIEAVSARRLTADPEYQYELAQILETFLVMAGREHEALKILEEMIELDPDDVLLPISKASLYLYHLEDPEGALRCIDLALELAYRTLLFRRQALGVKARILLKLGRGDQLSDVLEEIMSLRMIKDVADIGRERDFVDRAPAGLIRKDVLDRYNEFRPKRTSDSTADEPPEFEHPDDAE